MYIFSTENSSIYIHCSLKYFLFVNAYHYLVSVFREPVVVWITSHYLVRFFSGVPCFHFYFDSFELTLRKTVLEQPPTQALFRDAHCNLWHNARHARREENFLSPRGLACCAYSGPSSGDMALSNCFEDTNHVIDFKSRPGKIWVGGTDLNELTCEMCEKF